MRNVSLEAANALLPRIIAHYNARFGQAPRSPHDAHRGLDMSPEQLLWITSEQHARTLSKSLSCQYHGRQYLIQTAGAPAYHLHGARITVCDDGPDQSVVLLYQGKPLSYRPFARHDLPPRIADDKTLDDMVEQAKRKPAKASPPAPPPAHHPWRKPFNFATVARLFRRAAPRPWTRAWITLHRGSSTPAHDAQKEGDNSLLEKRGHFYFALTLRRGTKRNT